LLADVGSGPKKVVRTSDDAVGFGFSPVAIEDFGYEGSAFGGFDKGEADACVGNRSPVDVWLVVGNVYASNTHLFLGMLATDFVTDLTDGLSLENWEFPLAFFYEIGMIYNFYW
jgi:hypothetical protein